MALTDKYHINPKTGMVSRCTATIGQCPFGSLDHHFRDERSARAAFENKARVFQDWTSRSSMPQEEGWYTQHVFDPKKPETFHNHLYMMSDLPTGTRLVMENGWVFEKTFIDNYWDMKAGDDTQIAGPRKGAPQSQYIFMAALDNFGGRLEFRDGVEPMKVNWRS